MESAVRSRCVRILLGLLLGLLSADTMARADKIDATPGRQYKLSKQHGPWMIMVASLHETPIERRVEGMSAQEAADKLVYELRKKSIPAYTFSVDEVTQPIDATDNQGRQVKKSVRAQNGGICVIAGNYTNPEDGVAQKTLDFIKVMKPASWGNEKVAMKLTPGQPHMFSGAFLSMNPLLTPDEINSRKSDPLLVKINQGTEYSITSNKGKYTLVVATFSGRKQEVARSKYQKAALDFSITNTLGEASDKSWQVTKMLREGFVDGRNKGQKFEAYTFHDRYNSVVTVGSFDSPNDPRIQQLATMFGAKIGTTQSGKPFLTGETIILPGSNPPEPVIFDPKPRLIEVPKIK